MIKVILSYLFSHHFKCFFLSFQENSSLCVPWLIGILTFISFEALGLVYANVLKDQIFGVRKLFKMILLPRFSRSTSHVTFKAPNHKNYFRNKNFHLFNDWKVRDDDFSLPQHFDAFGRTELIFFLARILLNVRLKMKKIIEVIKMYNEQFPFSFLLPTVTGNVGCYEILSHVTLRHFVENK